MDTGWGNTSLSPHKQLHFHFPELGGEAQTTQVFACSAEVTRNVEFEPWHFCLSQKAFFHGSARASSSTELCCLPGLDLELRVTKTHL